MKCYLCDRQAWYRCARTGVPVCAQHARLEVVAARDAEPVGAFEVHAATDEDYPRLKELSLGFWGETDVECFGCTYDVLKLPALLARAGGELAGSLCYAVEDYGLVIVLLNVLPEHQGAGAGKALLREAVAEARRRGLSRVVVATDNDDLPALYLYQRFGFVVAEVVPGLLVEHHGGVEEGFAGIGVRDEIRLELAVGEILPLDCAHAELPLASE